MKYYLLSLHHNKYKMSESSVNEVIEFINEKLPDSKGKSFTIQEMLQILNSLYAEKEQEFTENHIPHRDWIDYDDYNIIYVHIDFIEDEIKRVK
jgi:hypothetical protein